VDQDGPFEALDVLDEDEMRRLIEEHDEGEDWGRSPDYDLPAMVEDMIEVIGARHREGDL